MTALQAARERLEAYVEECADFAARLPRRMRRKVVLVDRLWLRRLEDEIVQATRHETGLPF